MKAKWTHPALADLIEAQSYIARENPQAAEKIAQRIWETSLNLEYNPEIGRPGHIEGTREWVVGQTPYLVVYRIRDNQVEILRVWHARQNWQGDDQ